MFSLDNGTGRRFLTRSRLFTDEELAQLQHPSTAAHHEFVATWVRNHAGVISPFARTRF
jgi:hypothetical protein